MVNFRLWSAASVVVVGLASCGPNGEYTGLRLDSFDPDFRGGLGGGLSTSEAAAAAMPRPQSDQRGVISYPGYQVAVARQGDTVVAISARLGLNAAQVAQYNAIDANTVLNAGAIIALPTRVANAAPATVTTRTPAPAGQPGARAATTTQPAPQPRQHVVETGETAWSIARRYGVSVSDLAGWNGLPSDMALRPGQRILIPVAGATAPRAAEIVTAPGSGSPTPQPPSAAGALPAETTTPASTAVTPPSGPDLGATRTSASGSGRFQMPVNGAIARTYQKGRNEGIDISAAPGTTVSAAGAGTVAAITRDVGQVPIVVIRHENNLMTVYAGVEDLSVTKGQAVAAGAALGKASDQGLIHFEVREGFDSVDPEKYLN